MRHSKHNLVFLFVIFVFGLILSGPVRSDTSKEETKKGEAKPIVIKSDTLEVDDKLKLVTFTGDVNAKKDNFVIDCQKMVVYYEETPAQKETGEVKASISKIVAIGQVKIVRDEGGTATSEKAVYYQSDEKMVLTGKPVMKRGNDSVEGDKITLFLKENRSIVEGSEGRKVKAIIFSKQEKK